MKGWADELLRLSLAVVLLVSALCWAVEVVRPFLHLLAVLALAAIAVRYVLRRRGL